MHRINLPWVSRTGARCSGRPTHCCRPLWSGAVCGLPLGTVTADLSSWRVLPLAALTFNPPTAALATGFVAPYAPFISSRLASPPAVGCAACNGYVPPYAPCGSLVSRGHRGRSVQPPRNPERKLRGNACRYLNDPVCYVETTADVSPLSSSWPEKLLRGSAGNSMAFGRAS